MKLYSSSRFSSLSGTILRYLMSKTCSTYASSGAILIQRWVVIASGTDWLAERRIRVGRENILILFVLAMYPQFLRRLSSVDMINKVAYEMKMTIIVTIQNMVFHLRLTFKCFSREKVQMLTKAYERSWKKNHEKLSMKNKNLFNEWIYLL